MCVTNCGVIKLKAADIERDAVFPLLVMYVVHRLVVINGVRGGFANRLFGKQTLLAVNEIFGY